MTKHLEQNYSFWVKIAAKTSFSVTIILVSIKLYAWLNSNAAAMLASATDSLLDLFISGLNVLVLMYALQPADDEHQFGHGKAESLAGIAQAAFINGSAIMLIFHGVERLISPVAVVNTSVAVYVTLASLVMTIALVTFQKIVIAKTQSVIIRADSLHYQSDILLNLSVLAALLMVNYGWQQIDGLFTIAVGIYLSYGSKDIIKSSLDQLLDREISATDISIINEIVSRHSQVVGFHKLRTRQAGPKKFVQLHIELPGELSLLEAHEVADDIERQIEKSLQPCEVIIHQDPSAALNQSEQNLYCKEHTR
ncbi:cation diffusion facilitator family transporter [Colwellia sp. MEBiC06753]